MATRKNFLTVTEAAARIGITPGRLRQMIRAGEAKAIRVDDSRASQGFFYEVSASEADRLANNPPTVGRPRSGAAV